MGDGHNRSGRLRPAGPLDFQLSLAAPHAMGAGAHAYQGVVAWGGAPAVLHLRGRGVVERPELDWRIEGATADPTAVSARLERWVSADVDLAACYAAFARDPVLAALAQRLHGLRVLRAPSLYSGLLAAVLDQQQGFGGGAAKLARLRTALGPPAPSDASVHGDPPPVTLARMRPDALAASELALGIGLPQARALIAVARAAAAGALDDEEWATLPLDTARERLLKLRGVGRWSADCALLAALGHTDALPAEDPGLLRLARRLYALRAPLTPQALHRRWAKLAPWRGYAAYYVLFTQWV